MYVYVWNCNVNIVLIITTIIIKNDSEAFVTFRPRQRISCYAKKSCVCNRFSFCYSLCPFIKIYYAAQKNVRLYVYVCLRWSIKPTSATRPRYHYKIPADTNVRQLEIRVTAQPLSITDNIAVNYYERRVILDTSSRLSPSNKSLHWWWWHASPSGEPNAWVLWYVQQRHLSHQQALQQRCVLIVIVLYVVIVQRRSYHL